MRPWIEGKENTKEIDSARISKLFDSPQYFAIYRFLPTIITTLENSDSE